MSISDPHIACGGLVIVVSLDNQLMVVQAVAVVGPLLVTVTVATQLGCQGGLARQFVPEHHHRLLVEELGGLGG